MLKNVILPFALIILTSAGTVYCWFSKLPLSLFGVIGFFTLGICSMYISYYTFYKIFPDELNVYLPRVSDLYLDLKSQRDSRRKLTKGAIFGGLGAFLLLTFGIYSWVAVANRYKKYQLDNFGKITSSVVVDKGYSKGIGNFSEFEYTDLEGNVYTDRFSNDYLAIGDTIQIKYSIKRPTIAVVIWPSDPN